MYHLSLNEYCVLDTVRNLSNNVKYNGWCVLSIAKISSALDLSECTVRRALNKLEEIELLTRRRENESDTAARASDEWTEIILGMKTNTQEIIGYVKRPTECDTPPIKLIPPLSNCEATPYQIDTPTPIKLIPNTNKDTNNDIYKEKRGHFVPPTLEEITQYCTSRKSTVNPTAFLSWYESNGWIVGKVKMKNWKAAVVSWETRDKAKGPQVSTYKKFN